MSFLTRSYDNARTGANTQESILTPDAVGTRGIAKLFTVHVNDDARGAEAQPLLFADLKMADGSVRDVLYVCSMGNHILAFDANDGTPLWAHPPFLGSPVKNIPGGQPNAGNIDIKFINPNWGILSTPVIDSETEMMYVINWTSPETDPQKSLAHSTHQLFAINIVDGTIRRAPLTIAGSVKNAKGDTIPFVSAAQKQRAALLLAKVKDSTGQAHKTLFMACGAVRETARNAHGWVLAFDIEKFSLAAAFCATRKSQGGGIWQRSARSVRGRSRPHLLYDWQWRLGRQGGFCRKRLQAQVHSGGRGQCRKAGHRGLVYAVHRVHHSRSRRPHGDRAGAEVR